MFLPIDSLKCRMNAKPCYLKVKNINEEEEEKK